MKTIEEHFEDLCRNAGIPRETADTIRPVAILFGTYLALVHRREDSGVEEDTARQTLGRLLLFLTEPGRTDAEILAKVTFLRGARAEADAILKQVGHERVKA